MLIKTNLPGARKNSISIEDGDKWLEENKHRKAENMDGQVNSDADKFMPGYDSYRIKNNRDAARQRDAKVTQALRAGKPKRKATKATARYERDYEMLLNRLLAGQIVKPADIEGSSKQRTCTMISRMREEGHKVFTLSVGAGVLTGWVMQATLDKVVSHGKSN